MTVDPANLGSVDPLSVEGIFLVALSKSGSERDAFLGVQCVDSSQRQRVEALLLAYEQAGNFLQKPAVAAEATPIGQYLEQCALPGTLGKLGPYEILEEIGRGGMGVVFRAHDPKLQRIVAVKALAPELARLPSARQRFLREARAAAAVSHPHVVTIFAVEGTEEASLGTERTTLPYLVMECIVGQTLHDKIKRVGALKVEEIVRISRQIAEGLTAAHKRGLIHRDIKPANILLENGVERVKITDFGLARTTSDGGITHTGEILGTPQCMSPEQARGEIVDQRSDLFSLGCVMYTMCTGVSPFRADNMMAVMKKVCENTPTPRFRSGCAASFMLFWKSFLLRAFSRLKKSSSVSSRRRWLTEHGPLRKRLIRRYRSILVSIRGRRFRSGC
jgi:serine/threonine protein kinase